MSRFTPRFEADLNAVFFTKYKVSITGEVINSVQFSCHFYSSWVRIFHASSFKIRMPIRFPASSS